ncbi:MAG: hypothetical protein A2270_10995 [Elusimicrobia bacterium RIFOXYA12_FULL_51_18]|nr:MAG: hypothetical protein A2270_10995 [Elusimicrobia bacterium RIFOXYA12_FULL_51_18]OGS32306.1 MAG: hypothetical protein A2218_02835 [Elusimicrobia bacterium RIFOXYA2_FULL_53_38]
MELGLKGKSALVTGGSHGIGRAISLALADEGCNIAICARNKERVEKTVEEIKNKGVESIGICADATVLPDIENVFKAVIGRWATVHILVNNVGGGGRWGRESVEETPEHVWSDVYDKNALAAIRFTMRAIPHMRKQKWGRVVTVSSIVGRESGGRPWYSMAKAAEISLMKTLAANPSLSRDGLTFNTIAPGAIMIPDTGWDDERKKNPEEFGKMADRNFPLGRPGTPEEVAGLAVFICSGRAGLLNGATIPIDGGEGRSY